MTVGPHEIMTQALAIEAQALNKARASLGPEDAQSVQDIFQGLIASQGQLVFSGVGKSGIVAQKLASTFSSLGLASFFLQPIEALHGDLGRVRAEDAVVWISHSGTTEEIQRLIPYMPVPATRFIGLVGKRQSPIAQHCQVALDCSVEKEACLNNLAPTTSTTVAMAMGDAMAVLYEHLRGVTRETFARNHPAGRLGKSLSLKVRDLLLGPSQVAVCEKQTPLQEVLVSMTQFPVGACAVLSGGTELCGIILEGDIRRAFSKSGDALKMTAQAVMTKNPITIAGDQLAVEALELMEGRQRPLNVLAVTEKGSFQGLLRIHDLFKAGLGQ